MSILNFQVHVGKTLGISNLFVQHKIHKLDMVHKMFLYRCAKGFCQIHIFSWILGAKANSMIFCAFKLIKTDQRSRGATRAESSTPAQPGGHRARGPWSNWQAGPG